MAEERQVFRAIANFSSIIKSSKQAEEALEDVGDAGEDSSRRVTRSMAAMAKDAKKQGEQAGKNLTDGIKDEVDGLQKRLKTKRLEVEVSTQQAQQKIANLERDIAETEAHLQVDADDAAARTKLADLKSDLNNLQGQVKVDTKAAQSEVAGMRAQLAAKKIELDVAVDQASAAAAEAELDTLARDRDADINTKVTGAAEVAGFLGRSTLSFGQLIVLAGTLGTALIPVVAAVGALAAALAAPLAVAGGAATVGGLIMGVAASQTTEQQKQIDKAAEKVAGLEKGTKEYNEALKELRSLQRAMTPAQEKFVNAQNNVKTAFERLQGAAGQAIFRPMTQAMNILANVLPKLAPIIRTVSGVMSTFLGDIGQFVKSAAFKEFISSWSKAAGPALETFGLIAKNMFLGLFGLFKAFAPLGKAVIGAILGLSIAFRQWGAAAGDKNSGVQSFIRYVIEQGPAVLAFFGALWSALGNVLQALAPIGEVVLFVATQFLRFIGAIPPDVLTALVTGLIAAGVAFKAIGIAVAFMNGALALSPFTWLAIAIGALVVALVLLYKRSKTARKIMNAVWNGIRKTFALFWAHAKIMFGLFVKAMRRVGTVAKWLWKNAIQPSVRAIGAMIQWLWNKAGKPIFNLIRVGVRALGKVFTWLWRTAVEPVLRFIGNKVRAMWNGFLKPVFGIIAKVLRGDLGGAWGDMKDLAVRAVNGVLGLIRGIPGKLRALGGAMVSAGKWLIQKLWSGLTNVGGFIADVGKDFANAVIDILNGAIPNSIPIPAAPDIDLPNDPIPKLARGGRASRDSHVVIGDGNEPESVLPDSMLRKLMDRVARIAAAVASGAQDPGDSAGGGRGGGADRAYVKVGQTVVKVWKRMIRPSLVAWDDMTRKRLIPGQRLMQRVVVGVYNTIGKRLQRFTKTELHQFALAWGRVFTKQVPADVNTARRSLDTGADRMRTLMGGLATSVGNIWVNRIRPVFNTLGDYIRKSVAPVFARGVKAIGAAWDRLRGAAARPVRFVLQTVINGGLIAGINKIAKFAGVDEMKPVKVPKFRKGGHPGKVRGSGTPRQDNVPSMLSTDEHVWSAQEVRGAGGHGAMERMRAEARGSMKTRNDRPTRKAQHGRHTRGYWVGGGVLPLPSATSISVHDLPYYGAWYAADMNGPYDGTSRGKIVSWKDGVVAYTKQSNESYGNETVVNHADGNFTRYAHQLEQYVRTGQKVSRGQNIGAVGETGNAQGAHLHFEIKGGQESGIGGGGLGLGPSLPGWAQKILGNTKGWARGLLDGGEKLGTPWGGMIQGALNQMVNPLSQWASQNLNRGAAGVAGSFGSGVKGIWKSLMSTGYFSPQQAAGVMGNMKYESGFDPHITNSIGATGLVQWYPGSKLHNMLAGRPNNVANQISVLTAQLRGQTAYPEAAAGQALKGTSSPERAAAVFEAMYERHGGAAQIGRQQAARGIFEQFKGTHDRGGPLADDGVAINRSGGQEYVIPPDPYAALRRHEVARLPGIGPVMRVDGARGRGGVVVNSSTVVAPRYTWHVHNPLPERTSATTLKTLTSVAQRGIRR